MCKNIGGGEKEFADQGAKDFRPHGLGGLVRLSKAGVGHVFGMKKCVEDAKIGTLRTDWRGKWVSLGVDLLNIKRNGVGGGVMWSLVDNHLLRERSLITCVGGVF